MRIYLFNFEKSLFQELYTLKELCFYTIHINFSLYKYTHFLKSVLLTLIFNNTLMKSPIICLFSPLENTKIVTSMYELGHLSVYFYLFHLMLFCPYNPQKQHKTDPKSVKFHCFSNLSLVADEIFHCVVREELFELSVKLRRQCLIMCNDNCRLI